MAQEVPPAPAGCGPDNPGCLLGGRFYKWLSVLKNKDPETFQSLVTSTLYAKKGMPRPSKYKVQEGVVSTFKKLTTPQTRMAGCLVETDAKRTITHSYLRCSSSKIERYEESETASFQLPVSLDVKDPAGFDLFSEVERTARELFRGVSYTWEDRARFIVPSTKSTYITSRAKFGAFGAVAAAWDVYQRTSAAAESTGYCRIFDVQRKSGSPQPISVEGRSVQLIQPIDVEDDIRGSFTQLDITNLRADFDEYYSWLLREAQEELSDEIAPAACKLVGLQEALKVRVISKGPPFLYTALKPLQKKLWSRLQDFPCFRFTGMPDDELKVQSIIGDLKPGQAFLSVDYSDATNEIRPELSEIAVNAISDEIGLIPFEREFFLTSLTRHFVEWENPDSRSSKDPATLDRDFTKWCREALPGSNILPQRHGQLMGSVMSFIILCVINAAILRATLECDLWSSKSFLGPRPVVKLSQAKMAVNGDDGLLRVGSMGKRFWEQFSPLAGLSPSVGKVYYSPDFLNIDSRVYRYSSTDESLWTTYTFQQGADFSKDQPISPFISPSVRKTVHFKSVPFVNLGLLFGLTRSQGETSDNLSHESGSVGARATALLQQAPDFLRERLLGQFIHLHKDELTVVEVPWFLPEHMGGLGLPIIGQYRPSNKDLMISRKIFDNQDIFKLPSAQLMADFQMWQYAERILDKWTPVPLGATPGNVSRDTLRNMVTVAGYLKEPLKLIERVKIDFAKLLRLRRMTAKAVSNDDIRSFGFVKRSEVPDEVLLRIKFLRECQRVRKAALLDTTRPLKPVPALWRAGYLPQKAVASLGQLTYETIDRNLSRSETDEHRCLANDYVRTFSWSEKGDDLEVGHSKVVSLENQTLIPEVQSVNSSRGLRPPLARSRLPGSDKLQTGALKAL